MPRAAAHSTSNGPSASGVSQRTHFKNPHNQGSFPLVSKSLFKAIRLIIAPIQLSVRTADVPVADRTSPNAPLTTTQNEIDVSGTLLTAKPFKKVLFGYQSNTHSNSASIVIPRGAMVDKKIA